MNRVLNLFIQFIIIFLLLSQSLLFAQTTNYVPGKERGDPKIRTHSQMEGNRVRTSVFNFAFTGRENGNFPFSVQTPYEWPKNTGEVYLALTAVLVGAEVIDNKGVVQKIIDAPDYRTSPTGKSWNIEPIPGYANPTSNSLANSLDPSTWPSFWPDKLNDKTDPGWKGQWNGYFGKNIFNADQELFAKASDDGYDRYPDYFPDSTDLSRKGLGLIIDQRTLAWSQVLIQDDVFLLYTIRNDGTKDIPKMGVTVWFADFVGGNGDSNDDIADFDILGRFLWSRDSDNRAASFGADPVGAVALTFLETPGNSVDRIDNDGDGESGGPKVTDGKNPPGSVDMLDGEIPDNGIDDNGNGLIDENETYVAFGTQLGTTFANGLDDNNNGEVGSPVVTQQMIDDAAGDKWHRWPPNPELDPIQNGQVWLIEVTQKDLGKMYKDNIDNNGNSNPNTSYNNLPAITQSMIDQAATDKYHRYKVPGTHVILYNIDATSLGKKYLNKDGLRDVGVDEGIDEMIDESRTDGIDNDGDWNPIKDDVGIDGVPFDGDFGEGDGKPTSGVGTGEPGEPHIDLTDVKETDQIGITNAQRTSAVGISNSDVTMWFNYMIPGKYFDPASVIPGEYDLWVSSSTFPMKVGDVQPFSMAVILVNGPVNDPGWAIRRNEVLKKRGRADQTYQNNYQFATAPPAPILTAIPGNNKVTLYWDNKAESSFDNFLANIGGDPHNFEGYRIYRSSDPAFKDAATITNGTGAQQFLSPLKIFDLVDGYKGFDTLGIDGIHYNLGDDSGIQHSFVDSTVKNGFTYYYAVVSYSKGSPYLGILPGESPIRVNLHSDGSVTLGPNVARVIPEASSSGYVNSSLANIARIQGTTSSTIGYEIVDPHAVKDRHNYYLTFQDTLITSGKVDTLKTKNYTLIDSTSKNILVYRNPQLSTIYEQPVIDGFRLSFNNAARVEIDTVASGWNTKTVPKFIFTKFVPRSGAGGEERPNDYKVFFGNVGFDTSLSFKFGTAIIPSLPVNFKVINISTNKIVKCGFLEVDTSGGPGKLSTNGDLQDNIVFFEPNSKDSLVTTWKFLLASAPDSTLNQTIPRPGDTANIKLKKPFLSGDVFSFTSIPQHVDNALAKVQLENVKVVPNPYLGSAQWESKNPYASGRGPRSLHFTHLPAQCVLRIFTADGELVQTINHNSVIDDGTEDWNMLSKDNLSISYGVYVLYVDAPGVGTKMTKFAVIK